MDLTRDKFLGGKLLLHQPKGGYRAGIDPVLLAGACPALPGEHILELGCGVGVASLCLAVRVPKLKLYGVEILAEYADLARKNALQNNFKLEVIIGNVSAHPTPFYDQQFHQVIMNPPFFEKNSSLASPEPGRASGKIEQVPLSDWIKTATKRLRPKGYLTIIQRVERLPEVLGALQGRLGSILVQPLAPRDGRRVNLVLVRARKFGRADFQLLPTKNLHVSYKTGKNQSDYRPEILAILRDGEAFEWTP